MPKRLVSASVTTQHKIDAAVAQSRQAQPSLDATSFTTTSEASGNTAGPWYQRLGLPLLKFVASFAVIAALVSAFAYNLQ